MNPLKPLYESFNRGDPAEKYANLPDFPRMLDVEPVGLCNFKCLCCPTGLNALKRSQGFMKWDVWRSIVDQCEPHGTALRPYGWGEPTLHPRIIDMIAYASAADLWTHMNTNGSKITPDFARSLVNAGLTSIKFSFQGADRETYAEMRQTDFFDGMLKAIRMMRDARGDDSLPYISASTTTTYETPEMIEEFRGIMVPLVDELSVGKTIFGFLDLSAARIKPEQRKTLERLVAEESVIKRHPDPCPEVYSKLSIHWDGSVRVCCNDVTGESFLGSVVDTPISEIWRHPQIEAYRERLARKDYDAPLCRDCWDYLDLTEGGHEAENSAVL